MATVVTPLRLCDLRTLAGSQVDRFLADTVCALRTEYAVLYQDMSKVSKRLLERKLRFTGHCLRAKDQPISDLLFGDYSNISWGRCSKGAGARPNYVERLLSECSSIVRSDVELAKLMNDRDEWRDRIAYSVREN